MVIIDKSMKAAFLDKPMVNIEIRLNQDQLAEADKRYLDQLLSKENIWNEALKQDGSLIRNMVGPSERNKETAIRQNPFAIMYMDASPELEILYIDESYRKELTPNKTIIKHPEALRYLEKMENVKRIIK
jgi:hypothetical protein